MGASKDNTSKVIGLLLGLWFLLRNTSLFGRGNRLFGSEIESLEDLQAFAMEAKRSGQILESKARGLALFLAPGQTFFYFEETRNGESVNRSTIKAVPGNGEYLTVDKVIFSPEGALLVFGPPQTVVDAGGADYTIVPGYALEAPQIEFLVQL
jgi:hypothetical protein